MQDTSLTISSTASSTTTFPSVSPWIYSLLTDIINTLPPSASTFEQLFTRYQQVLAERGIDEADAEGDQDAYTLLLKLSMQRGSTWAQKWANAQKAVPAAATPSLDILKARLDSLDATQQHIHHIAPPTKTSAHPPPHLAIPYIGTRLSSQVDGPLTSTPQRPRSAPLRKQDPQQVTPVKSARRVSFLSPRRPASSAELSRSHTLLYDPDSEEEGSRSDQTPELVLPPHPRSMHRSHLSSTPAPRLSTYNDQQLALDPKIVFADRFRRANLLAALLDRWRDRTEVLRRRHEQTEHLRQTVLLKRSLAAWHLKLRYTTDVLEPKANAWAHLNVARRTLATWVYKLRKKRKYDWEEQMRAAMVEFKARTEPRLLAEAWSCWRERALEVRADRFRQTSLLSSTYRRWSEQSSKAARLNHIAGDLLRVQQSQRLYSFLEQWHRATALKLAEREVAARHDELLLRTVWQTWYHRRQRVNAADMWFNVKIARTALRKWSSRLMTVDTLQLQAEEHDKRRHQDKARYLFKTWSLQTRARSYQREIVDTNLAKKTLYTWMIRCHTVAVQYEEQADVFRLQSDTKTVQSAWDLWKERLVHQQELTAIADRTAASSRLARSLQLWRGRVRDRQLDRRKADMAREFFLSRRAWVKWGLRLVEQRGKELQFVRELDTKKSFFAAWLGRTRQQRSENALIDEFQRTVHVRLAQETLAIWVQRVVDVRSRQMSVSQDRDGKIVHSAFVRWKKRTRKRLQDHSLAESFQDVKQEDLLRRSFWTWNATMHAILDRRRKAEERGRADRTVLLTAAFDKWRSKARKLKLSRLEHAFGKAKEQVQLSESLLKWKNKTTMLPAMRFAEKLAMKHAFEMWRLAVPHKHDMVSADGHYARKLLNEAIGKWRYVWRTRVHRRAVDRFRPRQLQRRSLPVQVPTEAPAVAPRPARPPLSESSSEPANLLQSRIKHRMKLKSRLKSLSTEASSTPTLVEDTRTSSENTERTPLGEHLTRRGPRGHAWKASPPSYQLDASSVEDSYGGSFVTGARQAPTSVSDTASSSAAEMGLSELKAKLRRKSAGGRASGGAPDQTSHRSSGIMPAAGGAGVRHSLALEAGRQRLAAFKSRRAESSTDVA